MDDVSDIERLVNQCRSNDVDVKVDAITKLQAEFEAGSEILDPDALITVFKTCLRTSNQHLTTATLAALPTLIPRLITRPTLTASSSTSPAASTSSVSVSSAVDLHTLRQVLMAFVPPGGVIDRLGDSREKAREKARESLVILGGLAFRSSGSSMNKSREGKGPETPLMIFERHMREVGLGSKVWRVREQSVLTLVHIRRTHHLFPIRSYLPQLVEALEDTDGTVRESARQSVVELFTGPGVTDAARADLKKEMTKKNVRKTIVDGVLSKVLSGTTSTPPSEMGSENGDASTGGTAGYVPPSIALMKRPGTAIGLSKSSSHSNVRDISRPASRAAGASPIPTEGGSSGVDIKPVYIASSRDLENEFASMLKHFEGKETEHNWAAREKAILRVRGMLKGEVYERYPETFFHGLKNGFIDASVKTLISLRTTVAANTCSLYSELALTLGTALDGVCEPMYLNLIRMASLTKKIIAQQSQATITTIIHNTSAQPRFILPLLWNSLQDKAIQTRVYAIGHVKTFLEVNAPRAKHSIETAGGVEILEKSIKKVLGDPNPGVRETGRQCFWVFDGVWKDRARVIMETLDPTSRKQLERACPNPDTLASSVPPTTPKTKKSSVAAAIAASRAKAKAIATAPPTLRHQATSAARTTSPPNPNKRPLSPSLSTSSSSGGGRAVSPISRLASSSGSPPRSRIVSTGTLPRSMSAGFVPSAHTRENTRNQPVASPPSPTPDPAFRRRSSSPLVQISPPSSNSAFRRAVQTALPASPPPSHAAFPPTPTPRPQTQPTAYPNARESLSIAGLYMRGEGQEEESLLLASNIPIPEDSDSEVDMDVDESLNLISFSTPFERYPPPTKSAASVSPRSSSSRPAVSNTLSPPAANSSPGNIMPQPVVEDALRARAEQAESAAQRLLELVEPEDEDMQIPAMPHSLLLGSSEATPRLKPKQAVLEASYPTTSVPMPQTPVNRSTANLRRAALFQDSPVRNGSTSIFDMINSRNMQSDWWMKRMSLVKQAASVDMGYLSDYRQELNGWIAKLEQGSADTSILKKLALLCRQNPVNEPMSPISPALSDPSSPSHQGVSFAMPSLKSDFWNQEKNFDRFFNSLIQFLDPTRSPEVLEYGLIVLWEILECQAPLLEGRESDVFSLLLQIRYCGDGNVMQATTDFRDALTTRIEAVYGLTTMHAALRAFRNGPTPNADIKDSTYSFGLIALGKFMLRLPAEVLEDELPRLRDTLISALTHQSSIVVREAAAASIIAAQLVIQDETHMFTLLDGLPEDKKNLLAYLFDKHSARGSAAVGQSGLERLEKEIRRLDNRTSTPPRLNSAS
ncbi:unnamed protein product [Somion occarium]|uniref:TOG domain-containing protein n=1 Tax=Somion occarium TaxID=3059160 RepID=A0ABP1D308_9APHY